MIHLICLIILGVVVLGALTVIAIHIKVTAEVNSSKVGLMPWHVTCLAIALCIYAGLNAVIITTFGMPFMLYCVASFVTLLAFGIVIDNLRKRLKNVHA